MNSTQKSMFQHMLIARTQLVTSYLSYIEFIAENVRNDEPLHDFTDPKTAEQCAHVRRDILELHRAVVHAAESYSHCYAAYMGMTTVMQDTLSSYVAKNIPMI